MTWVYILCKSEPLYTVGFYAPDGTWHTDSDHDTKEGAAARVHWLNGGASQEAPPTLVAHALATFRAGQPPAESARDYHGDEEGLA